MILAVLPNERTKELVLNLKSTKRTRGKIVENVHTFDEDKVSFILKSFNTKKILERVSKFFRFRSSFGFAYHTS